MTKATLWFWLAVVLTGIRAEWIDLTFPKFKNEATQERAEYYEGDILMVAWVISQHAVIREVDLYCTRIPDGIRWPRDMEYGESENVGDRGVNGWKTGQAYDTLGNAHNVKFPMIPNHWIINDTQVYPLSSLPMYDYEEHIECAFAAYGTDGAESNQTLIGYGYPFKYCNAPRLKPITTPFGLDGGPIDADDISNASSSTISTQVTSATGISTTGLPQNNPTATQSADGPDLTATSTSSSTVLPTGPATGIESGTAESSGVKKDRGGLSTGAIAGIAAGSATLGIVMAALAFWVFWRRRKSQLTAAAAAAATASASTADNTSPGGGEGGGGGGEGETQEKGAMTTYFKAELEDSPRPCRNELDGTWKGAEVKEKARMSELGAVEQQRHEIDGGGDWHNRFELA
ncbi:hypothetical protein GE21DRAFT_9926 [Neurospora crassa]|uniref:Uncharacterized protein n=1 Tax=Neurospora crassa (strain ATCC 24698 / 74-OR23-1A / CBS 708.71 / DSM 1257 / FGSC 987) TaxID=367110 RepID=Q7S0B4_NEUCR|nr:hypothetical protein NCU09428 [Neurospora crassa OR74A]EAA28752.2 hypothetical protein NCU09428 [Neurospora crassa OR74A]KHE85649.1 hypothetical protein GE21DRAFT_9926 [Neurospora crassa]|eukprot:XP_957988.2 hypothetical protein NCU09428 [Neurospora crassa OR74A]